MMLRKPGLVPGFFLLYYQHVRKLVISVEF